MVLTTTNAYVLIAAIYLCAGILFTVWTNRSSDVNPKYGYGVALVSYLAFLSSVQSLTDIGVITPFGPTLDALSFVEYGISYGFLFTFAARIGGATRSQQLRLVVATVVQTLLSAGAQAAPGLSGLLLYVLGLVFFAYIVRMFTNTIWNQAQELPDQQRLLYWKVRNVIIFGLAMLLLSGLLVPGVLGVLNGFGQALVVSYCGIILRIGFGLFFFTNSTAITGPESRLETFQFAN